jgi:hypothetical protein
LVEIGDRLNELKGMLNPASNDFFQPGTVAILDLPSDPARCAAAASPRVLLRFRVYRPPNAAKLWSRRVRLALVASLLR